MKRTLPLAFALTLLLAACTPGAIYTIDVSPGDGVPIAPTPEDPDQPIFGPCPGPCIPVEPLPPEPEPPVETPPEPEPPVAPPIEPPGGEPCKPGHGHGDPNHCHSGPPGAPPAP